MAAKFKTEAEVFGAIKRRFKSSEFAVLPGVCDATGARQGRTIDALVMNMWPSRGLCIHGIEIKVSRRDWQKELANPKKQETIFKRCDRFWLAVGDKDIVKAEEIPKTWGLLVPHGSSMKIKKDAPALEPEGVDKGFMAAVLRRASEAQGDPELELRIREELRSEYEERVEQAGEQATIGKGYEIDRLKKELRNAHEFAEMAGISFAGFSMLHDEAELLKAIRTQGITSFMARSKRNLEYLRNQAESLLKSAEQGLETLGGLEDKNES